MPPPITKPLGRVGAKWARRAGGAGEEYKIGVESTPKDWEAAAAGAENNYKTGVTAAAGAGRFGRGVHKAGTAKWKHGATVKGTARYPQGVAEGQPAYERGFGPHLEAIGRTDLPPRGARGADGNYARTSAIGRALHTLKLGR